MAVVGKIVSFWKQVKLRSSDMFTLFRVGVGVKVPTHKLHIKDTTDPIKVEGLQNDTTDPDKFLTVDSNNIIKYRTGAEVLSDIGGTPLTDEQVQDIIGAMVDGGTETNISVTYDDSTGKLNFVSTDTNTQLTTEEVQDIVGAMFTGNTETRISATYEDSDGTIDLIVDAIPVDLTSDGAGTIHANNVPTLNQSTTGNAATATLATNAQGITGATDGDVNITSDGEVIVKLDSDNDENFQKFKITLNDDTVVASIEESGDLYLSGNISNTGSDSDLTIESDGNMSFVLDRDNDETSQSFSFKNTSTEVANLDESGNLQIDGDLTVSGNDIKDSGGNTIISSDGHGVVTLAGGNIGFGTSGGSQNYNLNINSGSDIILEADQNGGGGDSTIQYPDSGGTNRIMLAADSDVVILSNRAANGTVQIRANTSSAGGGGEVTVVTVADDGVTMSQLLTAKQRHVMRCGFVGSSTSNMYLPFNYGGTFETTSTAGYLEYGGVVMPADGYIESVIIRSENACGSSTVGIHVAGTGTEVPTASPGSFVSPAVNMSADDTAYKFTGFVNQGGTTNSFSAGDVVMISFDPTSSSADTTATAVVILDWNNPL